MSMVGDIALGNVLVVLGIHLCGAISEICSVALLQPTITQCKDGEDTKKQTKVSKIYLLSRGCGTLFHLHWCAGCWRGQMARGISH